MGDGDSDDDFTSIGSVPIHALVRPSVPDVEELLPKAKGKAKAKPQAKQKAAKTASRRVPSPNDRASPLQPKKKVLTWQDRQLCNRELKSCERVLTALDLCMEQFTEDCECVAVAELTTLEKKVKARLGDQFRWIYTGEDLEDEEGEVIDLSAMEHRRKLHGRLRASVDTLFCMMACIRSLAAKQDDPNYSHVELRKCLDDCRDIQMVVPVATYEKYLCRAVDTSLWNVKNQYADAFHASIQMQTLQGDADENFDCEGSIQLEGGVLSGLLSLVSEPSVQGTELQVVPSSQSSNSAGDVADGMPFVVHHAKLPVSGQEVVDLAQQQATLVLHIIKEATSRVVIFVPSVNEDKAATDEDPDAANDSFQSLHGDVVKAYERRLVKDLMDGLGGMRWFKSERADVKELREAIDIYRKLFTLSPVGGALRSTTLIDGQKLVDAATKAHNGLLKKVSGRMLDDVVNDATEWLRLRAVAPSPFLTFPLRPAVGLQHRNLAEL